MAKKADVPSKERLLGKMFGGFLGMQVRYKTKLDEGDQVTQMCELSRQAHDLFPGPDPFEGAFQGGVDASVEYVKSRP